MKSRNYYKYGKPQICQTNWRKVNLELSENSSYPRDFFFSHFARLLLLIVDMVCIMYM